jgi:hypothetical protein
MSRHLLITVPCGGVQCGRCGSGFGIRKLESVLMQLKKRLIVIASSGGEKPFPERGQVLPPRTQVMMLVLGDVAELAQPEVRHNAGNVFGHREQGSGDLGVEARGVPSDNQGIAHQLDGEPAREHADRGERAPVRRRFTPRSFPPWHIPELDFSEQKRAATRASLSRRIQRQPKSPVRPHDFGRGVLAVLSRRLHHELDVPLVELVYELEASAARPRGSRN